MLPDLEERPSKDEGDSMAELVGYFLLFLAIGVFFVFIHLVMGRFIRPVKPDADKLTIYECGEPTIGSAWIQFDLRFYVVALLFVIFDVEVVFFFPWAVVFGRANALASADVPQSKEQLGKYSQLVGQLTPAYADAAAASDRVSRDFEELWKRKDVLTRQAELKRQGADAVEGEKSAIRAKDLDAQLSVYRTSASQLAWIAFWDILVFFGVLLVGFAYLWKRGDLDWVRSTMAERAAAADEEPPGVKAAALVSVGREI
jgi:NADH-quinone oxidoreductase subunit A